MCEVQSVAGLLQPSSQYASEVTVVAVKGFIATH